MSASENQIDLSGDGGVLKLITCEGVGVETPSDGCKVVLHYTGRLVDGTKFDSSLDRNEPFEFSLGKGQVIKAFDMGIASMKKGEKCVLTCAPEYAYGKAGSPPNIPPNSTLLFELEMIRWTGEDISPDSDGSIEKFILKASERQSSKTPNDGAAVKVHIKGSIDSTIFDERDVEFNLGEGSDVDIVSGVERAIEKMRHGERARVIIKPQHAFGATGNEKFNVPSNSVVEYEITLHKFEREPDTWKLNVEESIEQAKIFKDKGTKYLLGNKLGLAIKMYEKSNSYLSNCSNTDEAKPVQIAVYLNMALAYQKQNDFYEAKTACQNVLNLDSTNVKALFRRGQNYLSLGEVTNALKDFQTVNELEPQNKAAINQIAICKHNLKELHEKEKKIYAKMFEKFASADKQKEDEERSQEPDVLSSCGEWTPEEQQIQQEYNEKEAEYQKQKHNIIMLNEGTN